MGSWVNFKKLAEYLNDNGYKIHVILPYPSLEPIQKLTKSIENFIQKENLKKFYILAHSKGGIVAKFFMDSNSKSSNNLLKCLTIATPWQGTEFAHIKIANTKELQPKSKLLKKINNSKNKEKIVNIYGEIDNVIIPNKNLHLPGAKNIQLPIIGHLSILSNALTLATCLNILNQRENK